MRMKAVQINGYGGIDVVAVDENALLPKPSKGQVLVEVHAASINPVDWKVRAGFLKEVAPLSFPATLGGDFAGIITEIGEGVSGFTVGDEMFGSAILLNGGSGAFAQYTAANTKNMAPKPHAVNVEEAAALPLVGASAIQALEEHIKLKSGDKIVIHGGAGGIGHVAVQLAKHLGAYVATTVSGKDKEFVKNLGADGVIDYTVQPFESVVKDVDAVFDTVGGDTTNRSFPILKKGGIIVSMVGQPDKELAVKYGVTAIGQFTNTNAAHLTRLKELVERGNIKVHIDKVFPLDFAKEAIAYQETGRPRGKVVVRIKE